MNISKRTIQRITFFSSLGIFMLSLTQKSYCTGNECGYALPDFIFGWVGIFLGSLAAIPWCANPLLILSWILTFLSPSKAFYSSAVATALCFSFLFFDSIIANEAGGYGEITGYKAGYWLWATSAVILLGGNAILFKNSKE